MMRHVYMASLYLLSSVHTGGPSSKTRPRIDVMYVVCCVSLLEILDMTHSRVHALLFLTVIVYMPWLNRLVSKTVSGGLFGPQRINREMTVSDHPVLGHV